MIIDLNSNHGFAEFWFYWSRRELCIEFEGAKAQAFRQFKKALETKRKLIVSRNKKEMKLEVQRLGAKFTPEMLGDSDIKRKHHLSKQSYEKRMDLLSRIKLMSPELPLAMFHEW